MNQTLAKFGKDTLKRLLFQCTEPQINLFKRMYKKPSDNIDELTYHQVVDNMDDSKIDTALSQVERTIVKNFKKLERIIQKNSNK